MQLKPTYPVTTARLTLRPLASTDVDELLSYRGREDVCRYLPLRPDDPRDPADPAGR